MKKKIKNDIGRSGNGIRNKMGSVKRTKVFDFLQILGTRYWFILYKDYRAPLSLVSVFFFFFNYLKILRGRCLRGRRRNIFNE